MNDTAQAGNRQHRKVVWRYALFKSLSRHLIECQLLLDCP